MGLWTTDADLVAIGTGADELRLGPEELRRGLRRDFEQAENIETAIEWLSISAAGNVAWSAANARLTATVNGEATTIACRMTNVYEKRNGTWRIMLLHLSLPRQSKNQVIRGQSRKRYVFVAFQDAGHSHSVEVERVVITFGKPEDGLVPSREASPLLALFASECSCA